MRVESKPMWPPLNTIFLPNQHNCSVSEGMIIKKITKNIMIRWALFVTYTIIQNITSSEMCSLHLTHPSAHTLGAVGSRHCGPGSSWGFGALLKGLTSVIGNSCRSQDSNPRPRITSPTLYPLGHDCPNYVPLPFFFCLRQADLLTMHLSFFLNTAPWQQAWWPIREKKKHASLVYFQNCITCFSHFNHMHTPPPSPPCHYYEICCCRCNEMTHF